MLQIKDCQEQKEDLQFKNAELLEINNQLSSFAHIASHDLQEPLRKIQTLLSFLFEIEGSKFSERGTDLFHRITVSSQRMRALIQDLLTYASNDISASNFEILDLNEIVADVITELDTRISQKKAIISKGNLSTIRGIKFQIHQLFLNLVSTALKFSKPDVPPTIRISCDVKEGSVVTGLSAQASFYNMITVEDDGIGFDPKHGSKIFEMFQRLHRNHQYEGTGIGLAICKKVVDNHKGSIVAHSTPGHGATFSVFLPGTIA